MQITEPKKKIIELIETFMDKTLSFGCMVKLEKTIYPITATISDEWELAGFQIMEHPYKDLEPKFQYVSTSEIDDMDLKILWHYDIWVVLKCVEYFILENYDEPITVELSHDFWKDFIIQCRSWEVIWYIPNKPLHLYTEEEDKLLLELLQKLWEK